MRFCTLASGSKANATLVEAGGTRVLIDCGLGPRVLAQRLLDAGAAPDSISALIITHEHIDHIKGVAQAAAKWQWPVVSTAGTLSAIPGLPPKHQLPIAHRTPHTIGDLTIELHATPHDASEPSAVLITAARSGARLGIATDLGHVPDGLTSALERLDYLVCESNHDEEMLRNGPYPPYLQARIASDMGHLSNRQAGGLLARVAHRGLRHVLLAHLSQHNNTRAAALDAGRSALKGTAFRGSLACAAQDAVTLPGGSAQMEMML